jgi:ATP adenylyltransferase
VEILHAPWRETYLRSSNESLAGLFARILADTDDRNNLVLIREKTCAAILNRYPYSTGHTLIVPYRATGDFMALDPEELGAMMGLAQRVASVLQKEFSAQGFNIGFNVGAPAGAGVADHLHLHVVPRWGGDHNFMTVLAQTRVHPNELDSVWQRVHAGLKTQTP